MTAMITRGEDNLMTRCRGCVAGIVPLLFIMAVSVTSSHRGCQSTLMRHICSRQKAESSVYAMPLGFSSSWRVSTSNRHRFPIVSSKSRQYTQVKRLKHPRMDFSDDPTPPNTPGRPIGPPLKVVMPTVEDGKMDVVSRLLKDRILLCGNQINDEVANVLVAQMLFLSNSDPTKDIRLYINSPGGSITAGLAIFDTMQCVPCDIETVSFGLAASMGAFLLCAGTPGKRKSLPNARIMVHQPLGGAQGQATDIEIQAKEILFTRTLLNTYMAHFTGQSIEKIEMDCDRDFFMTPLEAKEYGLIDEVIATKTSHIKVPPMPSLF